jgi:RNA polymerase sigma factor (sigma-70 family)
VADHSFNTTELLGWVDRLQAGDRAALNELLRHTCARLERLARKMLRKFPAVRNLVQTDDVLQNALMRLMRALESVRPGSTRDFFGLAAEQMRRELLDLARYFRSRYGTAATQASLPHPDSWCGPDEPAAPGEDADDLERWSRFHEEVAKLPAELRELVGLVVYHGWTQEQAAELFNVSPRTVRRWWEDCLGRLRHVLKEGDARGR